MRTYYTGAAHQTARPWCAPHRVAHASRRRLRGGYSRSRHGGRRLARRLGNRRQQTDGQATPTTARHSITRQQAPPVACASGTAGHRSRTENPGRAPQHADFPFPETAWRCLATRPASVPDGYTSACFGRWTGRVTLPRWPSPAQGHGHRLGGDPSRGVYPHVRDGAGLVASVTHACIAGIAAH
jgi:hypothetical protein